MGEKRGVEKAGYPNKRKSYKEEEIGKNRVGGKGDGERKREVLKRPVIFLTGSGYSSLVVEMMVIILQIL